MIKNQIDCILRHPKTWKFYKNYGRCKFDPCSYKHNIDNSDTLEQLMKNKHILSKISDIDLALNDLSEKEREIEINLEKLKQMEDKVKSLEEVFNSKDQKIVYLEEKIRSFL